MQPRVLIAYASRAGSTAEVAEAVGELLRAGGASVDVHPVRAIRSVAGYDAVVLGTAIWVGKPLPEAMAFARRHQRDLVNVPVAYFILCDKLMMVTPENRATAEGYVAPLLAITQPVSLGLFAGAKDFSGLHPLLRWFLKNVVKLAEGDWRDWDQIRGWAAALAPRLIRDQSSNYEPSNAPEHEGRT